MFSFDTCTCLRMVEDCKLLGKKNKSTLQYAAMFNKQNIILMESPILTEDFGASFSCVDSSMREL